MFSNGLKKIPDKLMIILGKHLWVPRGGGFCGDVAPALDAEVSCLSDLKIPRIYRGRGSLGSSVSPQNCYRLSVLCLICTDHDP